MKKNYFLMVFVLFLASTSNAQTDEDLRTEIDTLNSKIQRLKTSQNLKAKIIELENDFSLLKIVPYSEHSILIDFNSRTGPKLPQKIKEGDFYNVVVDNINPNRYNVVINSKDTLLTTPLEMPTFETISLDALKGLTAGFNIVDLVSIDTADPLEKHKQFTSLLDNEIVLRHITPNTTLIKEEIDLYGKTVASYVALLEEFKKDIDVLKMGIYAYRLQQLKKNLTTTNIEYDFDQSLAKFYKLREALDLQKQDVEESQDEFDEYVAKPNVIAFLNSDADYKKKSATIASSYVATKSKIDELNGSIAADVVEKLLKTLLFLENENKFVSMPLQFSKESATVAISFLPRDSSMGVQAEHMKFTFPLRKKEYWSVGTSFYISSLKQERFSTQAFMVNDSVSKYKVFKEDDLRQEAGIAVTLRMGKKLSNYDCIGYHFSFGPGVSITKDVRPRLLFGGGLSLGNRHNLTLDVGAIVGFVDQKGATISTDAVYDFKPEETTVTTLKTALYFSLGYMYRL